MSLPQTAADHVAQSPSLLEKASTLLNANRPKEALELLVPHQAGYRNSYAFQCRLGNAYMGVVDQLVAANRLGAFFVAPGPEQNWLKGSVQAERIVCYLGVISAYGRALELLQLPSERAWFVVKNGTETLRVVEHGIAAGLVHAMIEPKLLLHKIAQVNSNKASQSFVQRALEEGLLSENDSSVVSFCQVAAEPLYDAIAEATLPMHEAAQHSEQAPQLFWPEWAQAEKAAFDQLPEVLRAASFVGSW